VEMPVAKLSERPPPPSQRAARLAAGASLAPARAGRSITPLPISVSNSLPPAARPSEPVPLVQRTAPSMAPQPPHHLRSSSPSVRSSLPPGLVEPKRIIEVIGSNVPVLDNQLEEEIEDLDDSEAHELLGQGHDRVDALRPSADLDLDVDFDNSFDGQAPAEREPGSPDRGGDDPGSPDSSAHDPSGPVEAEQILNVTSQPPAHGDDERKPPPKRRKRPPPPPARAGSGEHRAAGMTPEKAAADKAAADKAATEKAALEKLKAETASGARKWWEEMFSEEFLRAIPILSPRQLEREVNFIEEALNVAPGGQILDLACGAGQHAVELAARGYDLVGYDLSQSQLDWASGLALERNQRLQFTNGDMRELSYQESFDAIYSWNTSFGFFEEEKNVDVAQRIFRSLRPGGRFLLDVINRDFVVAQQPGQTWFEGDGCVCIDDVTLDFITSRMKVKRTLMLTNGKNRECTYSVRIYGLHELGKILHDVGFKILKVSGGPEMPGVFFGSTSPRVIILAGKPPC
jgi:SAM-dependent methyltransferase